MNEQKFVAAGSMGDKSLTGKSYKVTGACRIDLLAGKVRAIRSYRDTAAMVRQLGLMGQAVDLEPVAHP